MFSERVILTPDEDNSLASDKNFALDEMHAGVAAPAHPPL